MRKTASAANPAMNQLLNLGCPSTLPSLFSEIKRTQGSTNVFTVKLIRCRKNPATKEAVSEPLTFSCYVEVLFTVLTMQASLGLAASMM